MSNGVFNVNFLALLLSEILGGHKFTLGGPTPPGRPLAEKFLYSKRVLYNIVRSPVPPVRPRAEKFLYPRRVRYYV